MAICDANSLKNSTIWGQFVWLGGGVGRGGVVWCSENLASALCASAPNDHN